MTEDRKIELRKEGGHIHWFIYRSVATAIFLDHYVAAHEKLNFINDPEQTASVNQIINLQLDIEACEIVLRKKEHLLCKKVWLVTYLCETQPEYFWEYQLKNKVSFVSFVGEFFFWSFLTLYKTIKGHWFLWRYSIV